jgi:2-amino-4-hydroxy-6-hydroxymethyldihydropteridine diphosphokinase
MPEPSAVGALVAMGSNLEPERYLPAAVRLLVERGAAPLSVSSAWATAPVGPPGQPPFVNAALWLETSLEPATLKRELLRKVESSLGRVRTADRFAPRPIDLDLVAYGDRELVVDGEALPDPDLLRYAHIAAPASEVAPGWVHPRTGETLAAIAARLVAALPESQRPRRLELSLAAG